MRGVAATAAAISIAVQAAGLFIVWRRRLFDRGGGTAAEANAAVRLGAERRGAKLLSGGRALGAPPT
jgi:hypothetical protein